jgi:hypothetical protein
MRNGGRMRELENWRIGEFEDFEESILLPNPQILQFSNPPIVNVSCGG